MISGIYTIINTISRKIYVGYSINVPRRLSEHKTRLKNHTHTNPHLQSAVDNYGLDNFEFDLLEECHEEFLSCMEHFWCTVLRASEKLYGYNIIRTGPDNKRGKTSDDIRLKISLKMKGKVSSVQTRAKLRLRNRDFAKIPLIAWHVNSPETIFQFSSIRETCSILNVDSSCVNGVIKGTLKQTKGYKFLKSNRTADLIPV